MKLFHSLVLPVFLLSASAAFHPVQASGSEEPRLFEEANAAYTRGDYETAINTYHSILEKGLHTAPLHFNLASAYARTEQYGRAILHYRRALLLDPYNQKYRNHLDEMMERARIDPRDPGLLRMLSAALSLNTWTLVGVIAFWGGLALLIIPPLTGSRHKRFPGPACSCFLLTLIAAICIGDLMKSREFGIVVSGPATLKVAPTQSSPKLSELDEGTRLRFIRRDRGHFYVITSDDRGGWLDESSFVPIAPDRAVSRKQSDTATPARSS